MKPQIAQNKFVPGTSRGPRSRHTLALQMARAMAAEQRMAVGQRLKQLRGPRTQQPIADFVGVTLRAYQAWESGASGIAWPHLEKLAEYFAVSTNLLLYGADDQPAPGLGTQLDRIESAVNEIRELLTTPASAAQVAAAVAGRAVEGAELPPPKAAGQSRSPRRAPQRKIA